jgi:hypothetical protein
MAMQNEKKAMAQLRLERKEAVDRAKDAIKKQTKLIRGIREQLKKETATVPELAMLLGEETAQVLLFISGMRKYGEVIEGEKVDGYFKYRLIAADGGEQ